MANLVSKIPNRLLDAAKANVSGYQSPYSKQMGELTNKVVNREAFSFDPNTDQSYQALAQQYGRLGDRARQDTMADVSGNTGGMVSSWAVTAGQNAQNDYNQQLVGQIPSLLDAAYSRYQGEFNMNNSALSQLQSLDDSKYGRFADNRDYSRGVYESDRGYNRDKYESDRDYTYGVSRDKVADSQWGQEFNYGKSRDKVGDSQWQKEFGLETDQFNWQKKKSSVSGSKSSSGSGSSGSKSSSKKKTTTKPKVAPKAKTKTTTPFQSAIQSDWALHNYFAFK